MYPKEALNAGSRLDVVDEAERKMITHGGFLKKHQSHSSPFPDVAISDFTNT
ncbi:MAG: hypothetical protein WBB19_11150 [Desulforhopalus sp.]